jgi:membrane associated rhomboid family serine protease
MAAPVRSPEEMPVRPPDERRGRWAPLLFLLAPLVCCAPLILAALATVSVATLGTVGGLIAALLVALAIALWVRHRRRTGSACCPPGAEGWRR